jgi:DNA-binding transcriptional LysR family regulator
MQVELRQLRYFVAVAEELHFRRAAQRLLLTQPALSHQIARLERELGVRLLDRDRRGVALTSAGTILLQGARRALREVDQTLAAALWTSGLTSHAVRIGYPAFAVRVVRGLIEAFRDRHPEMWVDEHQLQSRRVRDALLNRTLDVGFVSLSAGDRLRTIPVVPEGLTVLLPAAHPLAERDRIPLRLLAHEALLMADQRSAPGYHAAITAACRQAGFTPTTIPLDAEGTSTLKALAETVAREWSLALLPADAVEPIIPDVVSRPIELPPRALHLMLAYRDDDGSDPVRAFTALVEDNMPVRA